MAMWCRVLAGKSSGLKGPLLVGRQEEKLKIGTPDGFVKIDVVLNQPDIDAVLRERTAGVVKHARELRTPSPPALGASSLPSASAKKGKRLNQHLVVAR